MLLLALGLAGCVPALTPLKTDPGPAPALLTPAASATGGAATATETVADAHQVHWRRFFKDPALQQLIETALQNNRDLRVAVARVEEARAQWAQARAERLPLIQLASQARLDRTYAEGLSLGPQRRLDLGVSMASFELDFFGRVAQQSEAVRAQFLATEEARRSTELSLISQIAELYHAQILTDALLLQGEATLASRERSLQIVQRARELGLAPEIELQSARMLLAQSFAQMAQLRHLKNQTDGVMRLLLGNPVPGAAPERPTILAFDDVIQQMDSLGEAYRLPFNLSADVLLLRPDVAAAEHRLAGARASVAAARAAFFPRVALTASAGTASSSLAQLFKTGAWTFAPSVSLPIFDGGRTQAGLDMAKAREVAVVAQYERTVQQAFREVADQLSARDSLRVQRLAAEHSLRAQRSRLALQRQRHEAGMAGLLEVLDAEREVLAAEQSHVLMLRAELDAAVALYRVLGGGAPEPVRTGDAAARQPAVASGPSAAKVE